MFNSSDVPHEIESAMEKLGTTGLFALVQGLAFSRLGPASRISTWFPPNASWDDMKDVRIFGEKGEWHAWNCGGGTWRARLWSDPRRPGPPGEAAEPIVRKFPLIGSEIAASEDGWKKLREASGAEVWVPEDAAPDDLKTFRPVLRVLELIAYDSSGIAGVVDCALRRIDSIDITSQRGNK